MIQLHQQTRKSSMIVKFLYFVIFRIRWSTLSKLEISLKIRSSSKNQLFEIFQVVRSSTCIVYSHLAGRWDVSDSVVVSKRISVNARANTPLTKKVLVTTGCSGWCRSWSSPKVSDRNHASNGTFIVHWRIVGIYCLSLRRDKQY